MRGAIAATALAPRCAVAVATILACLPTMSAGGAAPLSPSCSAVARMRGGKAAARNTEARNAATARRKRTRRAAAPGAAGVVSVQDGTEEKETDELLRQANEQAKPGAVYLAANAGSTALRVKVRRRGGKRGKAQRRHLREWKECQPAQAWAGSQSPVVQPGAAKAQPAAKTLGGEAARNDRTNNGQAALPPSSQDVINHYHQQQKRLAAATKAGDSREIDRIRAAIEAAGGAPAYQDACAAQVSSGAAVQRRESQPGRTGGAQTPKRFNSTEWILQEILFHKLLAGKSLAGEGGDEAPVGGKGQDVGAVGSGKICRLLDVGSVKNGWRATPGVEAVCVDPFPVGSGVLKMHILEYYSRLWPQRGSTPAFDCVALSMVLNCEGDSLRRGLMLKACADMTRAGGLILVALPRACLHNSRFCSQRVFLGQVGAVINPHQ